MSNPVNIIIRAIKRTMSKRNYVILLIVISIIFFSILVAIPIYTIPGNSLSFQLSIFGWQDYVILIPFSLLTGLMITMQAFSFKQKKSFKQATGVLGVFPGFVAGIFGSASCVSCIAVVFSFLGTGSILFLIANRWYIVLISALLITVSIYLTSNSIERKCKC